MRYRWCMFWCLQPEEETHSRWRPLFLSAASMFSPFLALGAGLRSPAGSASGGLLWVSSAQRLGWSPHKPHRRTLHLLVVNKQNKTPTAQSYVQLNTKQHMHADVSVDLLRTRTRQTKLKNFVWRVEWFYNMFTFIVDVSKLYRQAQISPYT